MVDVGRQAFDGAELAAVERWDRLVQRDPAAALTEIDTLLAGDIDAPDVAALAHGARTRCLFELGRLPEAGVAARAALVACTLTDRIDVHRAIAMSAAVVLAEAGQLADGLAALDRLAAESEGVDLGRVELQAAYVLQHSGRLTEALEHLDAAEPLLVPGGEERDRLRLHQNRGVVLLQQGRLVEAESDFAAAGAIAEALGVTTVQAQSLANRGVLHGRARRLVVAMRYFAEAAELFAAAGNPDRTVAGMEIDRAEVLMYSGLLVDALAAARAAERLVAPTGNKVLLGDAQLIVARVELAAGRVREAVRSAEIAQVTLSESGRDDMVAHARSIAAQAALRHVADAASVQDQLAAVRALATELRDDGWHQHADELLHTGVRVGHRFALHDAIRDGLDHLRLGVWSPQRDHALSGWYAEAVARAIDGDRPGALDACRAGLDLLDDIVAEAPTLERRSAAMRLGDDLSQLTIEIAIELGDADTVLAAAEGTRARALHEELADLHPHRPLTDEGADRLRRELAARLGDRVLVEWVVAGQAVWAVVLDRGGSRLVELADVAAVIAARDRLLVWLDVAASEPDASSRRALAAAARLDALLVEPLGLPTTAGVVMVPVGPLHGIPWSGLPSLAGRPLGLVPNAQLWLAADRRASEPVRAAGLVVGPDVAGAELERRALEQARPGTAVAAGAGATAATVRSMFAGLDLVHVAAHGRFRSDHPLLSTLLLGDGEATLYDTVPERVGASVVVMSSCEAGAQGVADGSEVLGLAAVMLARGSSSILAPLTVVRDLECAEFVTEVHAELAAGTSLSTAVAAVRTRWLGDDDLSRWAVASSFTCFGSGAATSA